MGDRAALLIRCSREEAQTIRELATQQRRTNSGYVLNILMRAVKLGENLLRMRDLGLDEAPFARVIETYGLDLAPSSKHAPGPRTSVLLWCSKDESKRIHKVARERGTTVSGLVIHTLRSVWNRAEEFPEQLPPPPEKASQRSKKFRLIL